MMSSLAYPQPTPPLFHNIAVARIASTAYLGFFPTSRVSLFIDCFTMTLKIINDALYIRYIVSNYTYIFGILDIISDILFIYTVLVDNESTAAISRKITSAISASAAYCGCKFNYDKTSYSDESAQQQQEPYMRYSREYNESRKHYVYSTIPSTPPIASLQTSPQAPPPSPRIDHQPLATHMTTFSSDGRVNTRPTEYAPRQINPFKSNFYKSSQSPEYEQEYENIVTQNTAPAAPAQAPPPRNYPNRTHTPTPNTMYVNFDEYDHGASNYANTFVSPYLDSNGSPITANLCTHETLFIVGNILHFIYQIMIYINIINTCKTYTSATTDPEAAATMGKMTRLLC
jgi:hypothetical protein